MLADLVPPLAEEPQEITQEIKGAFTKALEDFKALVNSIILDDEVATESDPEQEKKVQKVQEARDTAEKSILEAIEKLIKHVTKEVKPQEQQVQRGTPRTRIPTVFSRKKPEKPENKFEQFINEYCHYVYLHVLPPSRFSLSEYIQPERYGFDYLFEQACISGNALLVGSLTRLKLLASSTETPEERKDLRKDLKYYK